MQYYSEKIKLIIFAMAWAASWLQNDNLVC